MENKVKTLQLTLKKEWFDRILSGEKMEEYREIKPFWAARLIDISGYPEEEKGQSKVMLGNLLYDISVGHDPMQLVKLYRSTFKTFDLIQFTNGYGHDKPTFTIECKGISIGYGNRKWGAPPDQVFIIKLGNIISTKNISNGK